MALERDKITNVGAKPTILLWDYMSQYHVHRLSGRKQMQDDIARQHWDRIAVGALDVSSTPRLRQRVDL